METCFRGRLGTVLGMLSDAQLEHRIRLEDIYRNRVIALVSPIVGAGNVTAQVNLEMDFTRSEVTEEVVDPEGNALRSEQRSTEYSSEMNARGIPGATTNRAPTQTEMESQQGNDADSSALNNRSSSEVRNYEVSRTVSTLSDQVIRSCGFRPLCWCGKWKPSIRKPA